MTHSTFVPYQFGDCASLSASSQALCKNVVDYCVSFAASLDPNDGKGEDRPLWNEYSSSSPVRCHTCPHWLCVTDDPFRLQAFMLLNGTISAMVADTYREKQIKFIMNSSLVFHQ